MENKADFTHKELCLLLETICEKELNVHVAKSMRSLRKKTDIFRNNDTIMVERIRNKQGTTRVSIFMTKYCGDDGEVAKGYTVTL